VTKRAAAIFLLLLAGSVAAIVLYARRGTPGRRPRRSGAVVRSRESAPLKVYPASSSPPPAEKTRVTLFFPSQEDGLLRPEARDVDKPPDAVTFTRELMAQLAAGPKDEYLAAAVPKDFSLRNAFVTGDGLVLVDFNVDPAWSRSAGSDEELTAVAAIVDTLLQNLAQTDRVKILVNGNEAETLAGHVNLLQPLPALREAVAPQNLEEP
jgi:spore germination protein GerM